MKIVSAIFKTLLLSLAIVAQVNFAYAQSQGAIIPNGKTTFFDANGNPLSSGKVFYYIPSTTTPKTTYQDINQTIPNSNPVILDAAGRSPAQIWGAGNYRQIVQDQNSNVIWDVTTSTNGTGNAVASTGDGDLVGTIKPWAGMTAPNQYQFAFGQQLSRTTFSTLFVAITSVQSVFCTNGNPTLTGLSDTTNFWIGMTVEVACVSGGVTTISGKTSNSVTLAVNANANQNVNATFFPWGNGDGSTTFTLPDLRGLIPAGNNNMGGVASSNLTTPFFGSQTPNAVGAQGGAQSFSITLAVGNLPTITSTGSALSFTSNNSMHVPNAGNVNSTFNPNVGGGGAISVPTATGGYSDLTQVSGTTSAQAVTSTSTTDTPITGSLLQPTKTVNYIIKVTPDTNSTSASGVTDINGMTGSIGCGTLLTCTGNVISVSLPSFTANAVLKGNGTSTPVNSSITDNGFIATPENIVITNANNGVSSGALTIQNASSNQDTLNIGVNSVGNGANFTFAPHVAQTTIAHVNTAGPIILQAVDCTINPSNCFSPGVYLDTLQGSGVTPVQLPAGGQAYGVTFTGTGQPTQGVGNIAQVNFLNMSPGPYAANSDSGAMTLNIYGWKAGDTGIQMWTGGSNATGTKASPAVTVNTDALGQVSYLGFAGGAIGFDGNPPVRQDARATETQTQTAWGGMLAIDTTTPGTINEIQRLGIDRNIMIGNDTNFWNKGANTFNGAVGTLLIKNGTMPSPLLSGINAAVMGAINSGIQMSGTTTNDNTCTGCYGEYTSSIVAAGSAVSLSNGIAKDITTLSLTAGDWDVSAVCATNPNAATTTSSAFCSISGSANTLGAFPADGTTQTFSFASLAAGQAEAFVTEPVRVSVNTTTTMHIVMQVAFAINTMTGYGKIRARRVR